MARYAYDVNTTTRLIDVHKQFQGGLKTVDTDDSLGAVFLREAQNVSLSEFGFLEKRYGTYENFKKQISGNLQGYWEFQNHIIFAVDGILYVDKVSNPVNYFYKENTEWRYPENILEEDTACEFVDGEIVVVEGINDPTQEPIGCSPQGPSFYYSSCTIRTCSSCENTWNCIQTNITREKVYITDLQKTRDMNAVNINSVLYIFTGTYPIYAKVVDDELKFFLFSIDIPTYDEIVVVGHNLLEDDYEGLYFSQTSTVTQPTEDYNSGLSFPEIIESNFSPKFPNSEEDIKFHFATKYPQDMDTFSTAGSTNYFEINLDSIAYRTTLPGASDLAFLEVDIKEADFETKSNYSVNKATYVSEGDDLPTIGDTFISQQPFSKVDVKQTIITGDFNRRGEYRITLNFELTKKDFLDSNEHIIQLYRYNSIDWQPFVLKDGLILGGVVYPLGWGQYKEAVLKITPVDFNGNVLKKESVTLDLYSQSAYTFSAPNNLNTNITISKYLFEFFTKDAEFWNTETGANGPYDLESNPENYYFDVVNTAYKKPVFNGEGNTITSSSVPNLDFTLSNLLNGNYDFRVRFVREEWRRVTENGQFVRLELVQKEFFDTIVSNVVITTEKLQDYPGVTEDFLPKLKALWSCNKVIEHFGKLMIWGSTEMPTAVFYSFPDRPTFFPSKFYLDFQNDNNSPVQAVTSYMNILVVQTEEQTWGVRGNSGLIDAPSPYIPFTINPTVGTIAYKSVRPVRNHLFFLSKQGVIALKSLYAADEQYNIDYVDLNIRNIVPQDTKAVGIQFDNQYWLNFPNFGITLRWYIDKKAWVQDKYTAWGEGFKGVFKYQIKDGKLEFITYPSVFKEGNNHIYKVGIDYSLPTDLGEIVVGKFETSFLNQNYPFHPKNYKEAKLDFTLQNEYNLSKDVIYFQDNIEINQSHFLDNVSLLKNHRYRIYYYNLPKNLNLSYTVNLYPKFYIEDDVIGNQGVPLLTSYSGTLTTPDVDPKEGTQEHIAFLEFLMPNTPDGQYDIQIVLDTFLEGIDVDVRDSTYDDVLNFLVWLTSENTTLNQDPIQDYGQAKVNNVISLQDRLGDWEFGQTSFGKKVTVVETIKLSGKGYNAKMYMEDYSKSKWTLESLGLTYKMKRARSR
jgi:hypothetical protein